MKKTLTILTCLALLGAASSGIDVHTTFAAIAPHLAAVKVPVLLPTRLPATFAGEKIYPIVDRAASSGYAVDIALARDCKGEHACSEGFVYGSQHPLSANDVPPGGKLVPLARGVMARYTASVVAAHPSDAYLSWRVRGAYYALALNTGSLSDMLLAARSMQTLGKH